MLWSIKMAMKIRLQNPRIDCKIQQIFLWGFLEVWPLWRENHSTDNPYTAGLDIRDRIVPGNLCRQKFCSGQSLSHVWLFATPWIAPCQASLSITNSRSSLKLMSIESVVPSSHLILCCPLLLLPLVPPSIRVFSNESTLLTRWPKYWSFSFNISPSNEYPGLISFRMDWLDLLESPSLKFGGKTVLE